MFFYIYKACVKIFSIKNVISFFKKSIQYIIFYLIIYTIKHSQYDFLRKCIIFSKEIKIEEIFQFPLSKLANWLLK